jgi:hypothetical protein
MEQIVSGGVESLVVQIFAQLTPPGYFWALLCSCILSRRTQALVRLLAMVSRSEPELSWKNESPQNLMCLAS